MKRKFYILLFLVSILNIGNIFQVNAQTYECRVIEDDFGYIVYQMRETSGTNTPTTSTVINDITFVIRYPHGAVSTSLLCDPNDYKIIDGLLGEQLSQDGNYDYFYWNADAGIGFNPPHNWTVNVWEDICKFTAAGATGSGLFEVAPNGWDGKGLNWNQTIGSVATDFLPTIIGSGITYSYPTLVYDLVWTGTTAHPNDWGDPGNWESTCGGSGATPNTGNNCVIPVVSSGNYPLNSGPVGGYYGYQPICDYLRINTGATMNIADKDPSNIQALYTVNNDLFVNGTLTIVPNGQLTVSGDTYIDAAESMVVQATSAGVGSFIDNGTITYGASGTAKVQTYVSNGASSGDLYVHLLGPTLDEENYTGSGTGAYLSAFNVAPGNTYAYSWNGTGWVNQYSNTYYIATTDGIALSTNDASSYTMNMTGELITGSVTSLTLPHTGSNYALMSNPYPSSIDFDAFATGGSNSSTINNKYWIWDASGTGNYIARSGGTGGAQHVQVGQAFFVETKVSGTVNFVNGYRTHSNDPFRDINSNELKMNVTGGDHGFEDELYVRFIDDATYGYDPEIEAYKWNSMYDDATMIRSIADDGSELAINFLPLDGLQGDMVSVPVHFNCGYTAEYTFDFEGIDSFEAQNEVWLEDLQDGDQWIILNGNPHYTFTANADDPADRFILHFFGPTGVDENAVDQVDIYSWRQYAYIKNLTNEKIKKVSVYDISGHLVTEKRIPEGQKLSKIWVADNMAYYIVQVITEKNVYTNKVLINK